MTRRLSLHARLLLVALVTSIAALLFAGLAIGRVLEHFVVSRFDERLDGQIAVLAGAVGADGRLDRRRVVALPGFERADGGWSWRVSSTAGTWSGGTALARVSFADGEHGGGEHGGGDHGAASGRGLTAQGGVVVLRRMQLTRASGPVEVIAGGPQALARDPLLAAGGTLAGALALLAAGLAAATWAQLRFGLQPVRALRDDVARVRTGVAERLAADRPAELRPLAEEVNALIDQNRAGLDHARRHVANLAHGLKTPLATLSLRLAREGASAETRALVAQLDQRVAHHLRRARSAAATAGARARTPVAAVVDDLIAALAQIHVDRAIAFRASVGDAAVAVERRDLEEILGNLLDNAGRHAAGVVRITAERSGRMLHVVIADDGPGMTEEEAARVTRAGVRLDESAPGYGFGLPIAIELAELYGGTVALDRSLILGGLQVSLTLPWTP